MGCVNPSAAGYRRHLRRREKPCPGCLRANADAMAAYRARRAAGLVQTQHLAPCGTESGYQRHTRHKEKPCDACRKARNEAERLRYQRRKAS